MKEVDRTKLREKIARIILEYDGRGHPSEVKYGEVADQILALIDAEPKVWMTFTQENPNVCQTLKPRPR